MSARWTEEELKAYNDRVAAPSIHAKPSPQAAVAKTPKYRNHRTVRHGLKFDSKLEADYYDILKFEWMEGKVLWFIRQAPFELPGGIKYRLDYLVVRRTQYIDAQQTELVDCKGFLTRVSKNKIRQVEAIYGVKVILKKAADLKVRAS